MAKKPPKKDAKQIGSDVKPLPVPLTQAELLDFGQRLAKQDSEIRGHEAHADAVKKDLKSKEQALDSERSRLSNIVRNKAEVRDVRVSIWRDYQARELREVREDTGEVVFTRPLRGDEFQTELLDVDGEPAEVVPLKVVPTKKDKKEEEPTDE
jgi:hypothetical protein